MVGDKNECCQEEMYTQEEKKEQMLTDINTQTGFNIFTLIS